MNSSSGIILRAYLQDLHSTLMAGSLRRDTIVRVFICLGSGCDTGPFFGGPNFLTASRIGSADWNFGILDT